MVDEETLVQIFTATLSADKATRKEAETALANLSNDPNIIPQLIRFACNDLRQAGAAAQVAQHAASIRVRNVVGRSDWNRQSYFTENVKANVRDCIVPLQCSSHVPPAVRRQLLDTTQELITYDYPASWPTLMPQLTSILDECVNVLNSDVGGVATPPYETAAARLRAALGVLLACCRYYNNPINVDAEAVDDFVDRIGPSLVSLAELLGSAWGQELLQHSHAVCQTGVPLTFEISPLHTVLTDCLRIVLKCFHELTASRWPRFLCEKPEMEHFCRVCVVQLSEAAYSTLLPLYRHRISSCEDDENGEVDLATTDESAVWKLLKWVTRLSYQLVQELMFPKKCESRARGSAKYFCENILLPLVQQALEFIRWHASPRIVTSKAYILALEIITLAVEHSAVYRQILFPNAGELLTQLLFPRLAFSSVDAELWSTNPVEYVRRQTDPQEDMYSARVVSGSLILALTTPSRPFHDALALTNFMHFVLEKLSTHSAAAACGAVEESRVVDACFFAVYQFGGMLDVAGFPNERVEWLITEYIIPAAAYPAGILRARCALVLSVLAPKIKWSSSQAYQRVVHVVLRLLQDAEPPVRIQACSSFAPLICHPFAHEMITPVIGEVIQNYFSAMRMMDNEGVVRTLRKTIRHYRRTLSQWALQLTDVLAQHFEQMLGRALSEGHTDSVLESLDACNSEKSSKTLGGAGESTVSDSIMAADEVLDTLVTLVRSLPQPNVSTPGSQPVDDLLLQIQERTAPMLFAVLAQEGGSCFGFMDATLMLLTTVLSKSTAVSTGTWKLLLCLYQLVSQGSVDYFSQMLPPLDNFVCVAPREFLCFPMKELCEVPTFAAGVADSTPAQLVSIMCDTVLNNESDLRLSELAAVPKMYDSMLQNLWSLKQKNPEEGESRVAAARGLVEYVIQTALRVLNDPQCRQMHRRTFTILFVNSVFSAILADPDLAIRSLSSAGALVPLFANYIELVQGKELQAMLRSYDRRLFIMTVASVTQIMCAKDQQMSDCVAEVLCGVLQSSVLTDFSHAELVMAEEEAKKPELGDDGEDEWSNDGLDDDLVDNAEDEDEDDDDDEWDDDGEDSDDDLDANGMADEGHLQALLMEAAAARKDAKGGAGCDEEEENLLDEADFVSPIDSCNAWSLLLSAVNLCSLSAASAPPAQFIQVAKGAAAQQQLSAVQQVSDMMGQLMVLREQRKGAARSS